MYELSPLSVYYRSLLFRLFWPDIRGEGVPPFLNIVEKRRKKKERKNEKKTCLFKDKTNVMGQFTSEKLIELPSMIAG